MTVFTAHNESDLLEVVPALMGFLPTESIIVARVEGERRKFGFRWRTDIDQLPRYLDQFPQIIEANDMQQCIVFLISDRDEDSRKVALSLACKAMQLMGVEVVASVQGPNPLQPSARLMDELVGQMPLVNRETLQKSFEWRGNGVNRSFMSKSQRDICFFQADGPNALKFAEEWREWAVGNPVKDSDLYAISALAFWRGGDGSRALMAVEECEKGHPLADLVCRLIESGISPDKRNGALS